MRGIRIQFVIIIVLLAYIIIAQSGRSQPQHGRIPFPGRIDGWMERHHEFVAQSQTGQFEVVCLGDSITRWWEDHLDLWAEHVTTRPTAFYALSEDTTNNLLWRLNHGELVGPSPKLVIVLIGTNNRRINDDPADIASSILEVVMAVQRNAPTARILVLGLLPQGESPHDRGRIIFAETNRILMRFDAAPGVCVRDVGDCLLDANGTLQPDVSPDGTHLSLVGSIRFADSLRPLVREMLEE